MIENIRKYTGLMIVVLVLLFVGLVFLGDGVGNSMGSKPVMKVAGQGISQKDFDRNRATFDLPQSLPNTHFLPRETRIVASHYLGDSVIDFPQLMPGSIVAQMAQYLQANPAAPGKFIANRRNIQKAGIEYGVTPGPDEVESFVENVLFADPEGNYDQEAYSDFIKNRVSRLGGTKGFNEYIRDLLTAQNLSKLLGGGISPEMEAVRAIYNTGKQVISGQQVALDAASYEGKISPTEEQLKEYYEENEANYNSDERRSVSYLFAEPDWDAALATSKKEKAEAAKLAEEARKKQEEARKAAEAEAEKANKPAEPATPQKMKPAESPVAPTTPQAEEPTKSVVTEAIPPKAKELITKLRGMAIYFDSASAEIKATEEQKITDAAQLIVGSKDVDQNLTVGGYADLQGNADFNRDLSLKRANAVRDRLIAKGVPASRLTVNHFGEDTSKAAKDDLWKSRRVEISLTGPTDAKKPAETGSQGEPGEEGDLAPAPEKPEPTPQPAQPTQPAPPAKVTPAKPPVVTPKPAAPKTPKEQLSPDEKKKAVEALIPDISKFFQTLANNNGNDFEKLAADAGYTVTRSDFFTKSDPPEQLSGFIQNSNLGKIADAVFQLPSTGDPDEKLSNPYQTADGWFIGRLDEVKESVPLTFEEARTQVSIDLKKKLAREQMIVEAKALHEKIAAAVKEGKTFEAAAKEADKEVTKLDKPAEGQTFRFGPGQSQKMPNPPAFDAAKFTNPGEVAPLEFTPSEDAADQALIIYVDKREVVKDDEYLTGLEDNYKGLSEVTRLVAFENWLNDRYLESEVVEPNMGDQQL